ncbi:MAG: hypothetical protein GWQ05_05770 [Verrucomicrobiaceae bacterium]|nr:hypothetical protein [Verrucomicrobiaceae bacterium]
MKVRNQNHWTNLGVCSLARFGGSAGTLIGVLLADGGLCWAERDQPDIYAAAFGSSFDFARPEGPRVGNPEGLPRWAWISSGPTAANKPSTWHHDGRSLSKSLI